MADRLVLKVATGTGDLERCTQGLTVAATATVSGVPVSLWLAGDAVWLAHPGRVREFDVPGTTSAAEQVRLLLETGSVTVCARCANRRDLVESDLTAGVSIAGAATYVAEVMRDGTQALVY